MDKRILSFLGIMLFVLISLFYLNSYGFQRFNIGNKSIREMDLERLNYSGCEKNSIDFLTTSSDPQINGIKLTNKERNLCITLSNLSERTIIQVYYTNNDQFEETASMIKLASNGRNFFVLPADTSSVRIDIGNTENISYTIQSISASPYAFITIKGILRVLAVFFIMTIIVLCFVYYEHIYKFFRKHSFIVLWSFSCFVFYFIWSLILPFNTGPDEFMRYDIVEYILKYGKLPVGHDPILLSDNGWGTSYAFSPYLAYIIDAGITKIAFEYGVLFDDLFHVARLGSVIYGTITVIFSYASVKRISNEKTARITVLLLGALPEFAFLCAYVNNDSFALMCVSMIVYAWICGIEGNWSIRCCIGFGLALSLCFLSYRNSYGYILCSAILFITYYLHRIYKEHSRYLWGEMIKKGLLICGIVAVFAGWWLVFKYFAYDGDITASAAKAWAKENFAVESIRNKKTVFEQGLSLPYMFFRMEFIKSTLYSFFAVFDYMSLYISIWGYNLYIIFYSIGISGSLLSWIMNINRRPDLPGRKTNCFNQKLLTATMFLAVSITITIGIYFSYMIDYQPQGRYIMPILLPLAFCTAHGLNSLGQKFKRYHKNTIFLPDILCGTYVIGSIGILTKVILHYH